MNDNAEPEQTDRKSLAVWPFVRNLADIIVFVGLTLVLSNVLAGFVEDGAKLAYLVPLFGTALAALLIIWGLLRLRRQRYADIGLGRVDNITGTVVQGMAIAVLLFVIAFTTEAMGFERDFSSVRALLEGQPLNLFFFVIYAFVGAGLYEEATFRGFALNRIAHMFGAGRLAWALAAVLQGVLFGLAHTQQGVYGMFYTGALGTVIGFVFLMNGRNLWPLVLGHGLYDATRFIYFYIAWTYGL